MSTQSKNRISAFIGAIFLVITFFIFSYTRINAFIESAASVNHTSQGTLESRYAPVLLLIASIIALTVITFSYLKFNKSLTLKNDLKAEGIKQAYELELALEKKKNENRFREMVEQAPVAICLLRGKDFVVEIANDKQLQSWDRTKEEMLNQPIFKDIPEEKVIDLIELLNGVLKTGEPFIATEMASQRVRNGIEETIYVNFICKPFYEDHELVGIMAVSTDVTEQVLDRKQVEESESKFRTLLDAAPFGIGVFRGRELIIENPNQEFIDIVGKGQDIIGKRLKDVMPELHKTRQPYLKILDDVFTSGKMYQSFGDPVSIVKNGVMHAGFYDINYIPLFNSENQVYAILDVAIDVTDRFTSTKRILESEQRFQNLVRDASVGIIVLTGEEMRVEIVNEGYSRLLNLRPAELLNKNLFEIIPQIEAYYRPILSGVLESGRPVYLNESPYSVVVEGEPIEAFVNVILQPYRNSDEIIIGVIVIATDVTQQVKAKIQIEESEQRFQAAVKAVLGILWTNNSIGEMEGEQIGWSSLTGQTYEEYQGFGWSKSVHPDDAQPTVDAWNRAVRNRCVFDFAHRVKTKDGSFRHFSVRAIPLFNEVGSIRQWVGVHTDISEQKEAERKIRESESYFRRLTDTVPAIIWITEPDGSCSYLNKLWYDFTGQTKEEALGIGWLEAIHPDDKEQAAEIFILANSSQKPFSTLSRFRNSIGEYRWAVDSGSPKYDPNGVYEGMIGTVIDVHEEKLAEEKLAYRTALLEAHNQASVDGILLVDAKGKIISYNQRFIEIWNMPQHIVNAKDDDAALSYAMSQLIHPQQFINKVRNLYEHPTELTLDDLEFKEGKIVERNGYPVIGEDGSYYAWSWTFKDVTRQKHIEREIRESEERFRSLTQTLPQLVWVTDGQGNIEFTSDRWKIFSGLEMKSGLEWKAIVHPDDYENNIAEWNHSLNTGKAYKTEVRLKNLNGEYLWHTVLGEPVLNQDNKIVKWVGAFTDNNEQKLIDERKDEFLSIASHEMKTPLTTAKAYLQMLELTLDESNEEASLFTKKANQSVNRLEELVSELLDVSKIRFGKLQYDLNFLNFNDMLEDTIESIQLTSPTHKIIKSGKVNDQVFGDKYRLQQVVINLLSNAIKYSPGSKEVFIAISQEDDTIRVSVTDTGIGIAQTSLVTIFDKYHRIEEHAVHFQGLGIGLFISYEIIQRHKGDLWAESEIGKGSTFYFTLPLNYSSANFSHYEK